MDVDDECEGEEDADADSEDNKENEDVDDERKGGRGQLAEKPYYITSHILQCTTRAVGGIHSTSHMPPSPPAQASTSAPPSASPISYITGHLVITVTGHVSRGSAE